MSATLPTVLRVGLTGGIASGKSEVARLLGSHGAVVIDADQLAREVAAPGSPGWAEVVRVFGTEVLTAEGELDRPALARRVFGEESARRALEQIIHPRVRARAAALEDRLDPDALVVHDIPLLVETGQSSDFDVVVVVEAAEEVQVERATAGKGLTEQEVRSRMSAQATPQRRREVADYVLDNTGTRDELQNSVRELWCALRDRAAGT